MHSKVLTGVCFALRKWRKQRDGERKGYVGRDGKHTGDRKAKEAQGEVLGRSGQSGQRRALGPARSKAVRAPETLWALPKASGVQAGERCHLHEDQLQPQMAHWIHLQ